MVGELQRCRASAAFGTIDHDEVGQDAGVEHGLADREPLPRVADAQLETGGLATGQPSQSVDELHHLNRCLEGAVVGRADAVHTHGHAARCGDFRRHLGAWQHPTVAGFGALAELELDHLDLRVQCVGGEALFAEAAVVVAATEVAGADFPDQVTAVHPVVLADRTFSGVVGKVAAFGAAVEGQHGVGAERTKAHRRDVEHAGAVGLGATGAARADGQAEIMRSHHGGRHGMVDPLVADGVDIELGAKGPLVAVALGALVNQAALLARKRRGFVVAFDEVLADLGTDEFQQEAQMPDDRVVAQHRVAALVGVTPTQAHQKQAHQARRPTHAEGDEGEGKEQGPHSAEQPNGVPDRKVRVDPVQPLVHGWFLLGFAGTAIVCGRQGCRGCELTHIKRPVQLLKKVSNCCAVSVGNSSAR